MKIPKEFREKYPSTRVIIDVQKYLWNNHSYPSFKKWHFVASYKNHNTFKALVGISPDSAITFVASLYPGCISDKQLTRKSGILDLLEEGDSVLADRGFEIEEDLMIIGVRLNLSQKYLCCKKGRVQQSTSYWTTKRCDITVRPRRNTISFSIQSNSFQ